MACYLGFPSLLCTDFKNFLYGADLTWYIYVNVFVPSCRFHERYWRYLRNTLHTQDILHCICFSSVHHVFFVMRNLWHMAYLHICDIEVVSSALCSVVASVFFRIKNTYVLVIYAFNVVLLWYLRSNSFPRVFEPSVRHFLSYPFHVHLANYMIAFTWNF